MTKSFEHFGSSHIFALLSIFVTLYIVMRIKPEEWQRKHSKYFYSTIGWIVLSVIPLYQLSLFISGSWTLSIHLPIHISNLILVWMGLGLVKDEKIWGALSFFWGLPGALGSFIFPDLNHDFPHLLYFAFWLTHGLMILCLWFIIQKRQFVFTLKDVLHSYWVFLIYFVIVLPLNVFIDGNYGYLKSPPPSLDFLVLDNTPVLYQIMVLTFIFSVFFSIFLSYKLIKPLSVTKDEVFTGLK